jgi:pyruvate oxidase
MQNQPVPQPRTVAETILQQLALWGVQRVYGVVGDAILGLMDALAKQNQIRFIAVKHEAMAAMMASAEAKLTGRVGVCVATMGPGMVNLLNGLADAHLDQAPVLAITGQAPLNKVGADDKQVIDQQLMIQPLARFSTLLASPDATVDLLSKALHLAQTEGGVTHLSIPKDLFTQTHREEIRPPVQLLYATSTFSEESLRPAIETLKFAERPLIVAGIGAREAMESVKRLAEVWGAGLIVSLGAKGSVEESFPLLVGGLGEGGNPEVPQLLQDADLVLLLGTTWWPEGFVPKRARIVQVDAAPRNIGHKMTVEIGVVGDVNTVLPVFLEALRSHMYSQSWVRRVKEVKERWDRTLEEEGNLSGFPLPPQRVIRAIERQAAPDAILTVDTGDHTVWFNRLFRAKGQTVLFSGDWRTMGFALPAAIAAKLACPERQVLALVGDGGLAMSSMELSTAVRYLLPITVVVMNNGALQMEKSKMIAQGYMQEGVDLHNPDFAALAQACGWNAVKVGVDAELEHVLQQALQSDRPTLVDVPVQSIVPPLTAVKPLPQG